MMESQRSNIERDEPIESSKNAGNDKVIKKPSKN